MPHQDRRQGREPRPLHDHSAKDQARWSPGVNVGKPIELSDTCVLIKHREQWLFSGARSFIGQITGPRRSAPRQQPPARVRRFARRQMPKTNAKRFSR
jgi:hypothetical protein